MRWQRDERGQIGAALAAMALAAAVMGAIFGFGRMWDQAHESEALKKQQAREALEARKAQLPPVQITIFPLPNAHEPRQCILDVIAQHGLGLQWTSNGWRAPLNYAYPDLTGDLATDKAALATWQYGIEGYIRQNAFKWESCDKERLGQPKVEQPKQVANWSGTYKVSLQSTPTCPGAPGTLPVTHSGPNVTIQVPFPRTVFTLTGPLSSDNGFDLRDTPTRDLSGTGRETPYDVRIRGRFDTFNEQRLIRGGVIEITSVDDGVACTFAFEGST